MISNAAKLNLQNKNILLISPELWEHIFVSKHHYATHLGAKGNRVFFLNPPAAEVSCQPTDHENVFSVHYKGFIKGLRFFPAFLQQYLMRQKFNDLQHLCGVSFDIVWSFDNSVFYDFSALPDEVFCISHIVDLNQDFEFAKAARTTDLCLSVSEVLLQKQLNYNQKSHKIGHGYAVSTDSSKAQLVLTGENKIKCGYAGNLDIPYLDWELLEALIVAHPKVDFHFAGKWTNTDKKRYFDRFDNFYYVGMLKAVDLQAFYMQMDVLLITYLYEQYPDQLANPHKMMEYLASGKMILATWTDEYQSLDTEGLIQMTKTGEEYKIQFTSVIKNIHEWNSEAKYLKRKSFALTNTYPKQIERIENLIMSTHSAKSFVAMLTIGINMFL